MSLQTAPRLCRDDGQQADRAATLAEIDRHLDNLKRCIHWLVAQGIAVVAVDMARARRQPQITVAPSPWLHSVFGNDCATVKRKQEGAYEVFTWQANRHGCVIRWSEFNA